MSQTQPFICLYPENVTDIQKAIDMAKKATYNRVISRITCPQLSMRGDGKNGEKRMDFARSELLLSAEQWRKNTILKVGDGGDCESCDKFVWKQSNQNVKQEIEWAKHLDELACIIVTLNHDQSTNLARQIVNSFDRSGCVLAEIPIVDKSFFTQIYNKNRETIELTAASTDVWRRWNQFRLTVDFNTHFKVALELTSVLPNESELNRWCGEPIEMVIIPSNFFKKTSNNNQVLFMEPYREVCLQLFRCTQTHFAIQCKQDDLWMSSYAQCLRDVLSVDKCKMSNHECNVFGESGLKFPVTPRDTVNNCYKYQQNMFGLYEQAIRLAIADRLQSEEKVRLLICGSNGWKLLSPVLAMTEITDAVEIFVHEENESFQVLIYDIIDSLYSDKNVTVISDSNTNKYNETMDIIVSITLEAIYESQWLQFNFESVKNYMRSNAILIPRHSSLTIMPVTAARVYSYLQQLPYEKKLHQPLNGIEYYETRAQTVCPLYTRNLYECAAGQELFSYRHVISRCVQISSDTRCHKLSFNIDRECVVTGFCGYFQATLYKNITLNNQAGLQSHNRGCIPTVYFPLKSAQTLAPQSQLNATFWLIGDVDRRKYWYEWQTTHPIITGTHNLNGDSCSVQEPIINPQ